jgi:predicted DsbA family dithiol-disulfide isomerase
VPGDTIATIHVDPACPWAWLTSRWLAEVEKVRPVKVVTRLFSLAEINRGREKTERVARAHSAGEVAMRVLVDGRRHGGDDAISKLYAAIGHAHHEAGAELDDRQALRGAAIAAELDPEIVDEALADDSTYEELLAEHRAIADRGAFGVPTMVIAEAAPTFGPCLDVRISGGAAGELWDRVAWLIEHDHFFELKRGRGRPDVFGRPQS